MTTDYVSLETAKLLKEVGYSQDLDSGINMCYAKYGDKDWQMYRYAKNPNRVVAPLLYFAQKWLREEHKIHIIVSPLNATNYQVSIRYCVEDKHDTMSTATAYKTYELALDNAIAKACEMIINLKKTIK